MTDKQMINTCEFFNICESACGGTLEDTEMCSCYELYKQLKRKEQECEELKEWKKEHLKDVELIERNPVIDILNSMADNILLEQRNEKLKQTLTEIKEIAEAIVKGTHFTDDIEGHLKELTKQILQKISECEVNNDR